MGKPSTIGWHSRGYLPHYDGPGMIQHVVLAARCQPDGRRMRVFSDAAHASLMQGALLWFDGQRYDLLAWCVMPDHVHVMVLTYPNHTVSALVASWKRHVSAGINRMTGSSGSAFGEDHFDRYARSAAQVQAMQHYIETNPVREGLCERPQDWPWGSALARKNDWIPCTERVPLWIE